ncbi:MAG TPA: T9SS type A sorting domain-containing protein [Ohtaekwangia sp.]|nr:T9SS type A sorting domain-containing protein [Ohtaekwangia sp.]
MRKLVSLIFVFLCLSGYSQRYLADEYPELDSIIGGTYGTATDYQGVTQNLQFDFYEPANDTNSKRPLIIYLHGGGFNSGSRSYPSVKLISRRMATKGYAVANIDYRLDPDFNLYNSSSDRRAMTDAMHDAKQAIRYFKANAAIYKIDTAFVFIGGESAGAITAMMASFVDKQSEMTPYPMADPNDPIGSTSNADMSNSVKGTLCLCGMILDTLAIESPTDPPILWTHGTDDNFIPLWLAFNVVLRASHIGLPIEARPYQGATHCPWYYGNPNWLTYLDSTVTDITNFLYPKISHTVGTRNKIHGEEIDIYPNPFKHIVTVSGISFNANDIKIYNMVGQDYTTIINVNGNDLNLSGLPKGMYILRIQTFARIVHKQ